MMLWVLSQRSVMANFQATSSKRCKIDGISHGRESEDPQGKTHNRHDLVSQDTKTELRHWLEMGMKRKDAYGGYSNADVLDGFHDVRRKAHAYLLETLQGQPGRQELERRYVSR